FNLLQHRDALEEALRAEVGGRATPADAAMRYVMGWEDEHGRAVDAGGKRIRPTLCLFAAEAVGGTIDDAMPGAIAVELVHNFSLVHDEVQDHDADRHHRPTIWARMGEGQAINIGDLLYTRAIRALSDGPGDLSRRMHALAVLNLAIERMIRGQWDDIAFEARDDVTVDDYLAMVAGKTGALLSAPLEIGAILAGATPDVSSALGRWGMHVGAAFQAQDDFLGIWGDPGETGKSNQNDIARRKKTLPIVHALAHPEAGPLVRRVYAQGTIADADVATVARALAAAGSDAYCRERARAQAAEADALLSVLEFDDATREQFAAVAAYFVERTA
ncbi:MAG: polyprenyl synthetase family protein, partial [Tepidiformaceae bacterium]